MITWLISGGLEPVPGHTEKLCIASYCRQFSKNIKLVLILYFFILISAESCLLKDAIDN